LHQLLKLPALLHHYFEHKHENSKVTFINYLSIHYLQTIQHTHDTSNLEHESLPFKANDCTVAHVFMAFITSGQFALQPSVFSKDVTLAHYSDLSLTSSCEANIWQPPKTIHS
jgi:hypothetical protein